MKETTGLGEEVGGDSWPEIVASIVIIIFLSC